MESPLTCAKCGACGKLLRCARCQEAYYCSKEHQRLHWKSHKMSCKKSRTGKVGQPTESPSANLSQIAVDLSENFERHDEGDEAREWNASPISHEGSSEAIILNTQAEILRSALRFGEDQETFLANIEEISRMVCDDLDKLGVCVLDDFIGPDKCSAVLEEVQTLYESGVFTDGQLVSGKGTDDVKRVRGDKITWIIGKGNASTYTEYLITKVDAVVKRANQLSNGILANHTIKNRSKAMIACYPGNGTHYVKHVDNPNRDGRCITAIYYLNKNWDVKTNGGLLRIFPEDDNDAKKVADIEPLFDRILFFWSDRRNPHEVQPAFATRYAITLWYFDRAERSEACRRHKETGEVEEDSDT